MKEKFEIVDAAQFSALNETYSGDIIGDANRIRKPVVFGSEEFVVVGAGGDEVEAYRVMDRGVFVGPTFHYNYQNFKRSAYYDKTKKEEFEGDQQRDRREGFYHGMAVKTGERHVVLSGPPVTFKVASENHKSESTETVMKTKKIDRRTTRGKLEYRAQLKAKFLKGIADKKTVAIRKVRTARLGRLVKIKALAVVPPKLAKLDFDDWKAEGKKLKMVELGLGKETQRLQMSIGAWYNFGVNRWKKNAERAAKVLGYTIETIRNFAWVDRRIGASLRNDGLTFEHYRIAAGLPKEKQRQELLNRAVKQKLSGKELRRQVQAERGVKPKPSSKVERKEEAATGLTRLVADWRAFGKNLMATPSEDKIAKAQADVYYACAHALATALGLGDA